MSAGEADVGVEDGREAAQERNGGLGAAVTAVRHRGWREAQGRTASSVCRQSAALKAQPTMQIGGYLGKRMLAWPGWLSRYAWAASGQVAGAITA